MCYECYEIGFVGVWELIRDVFLDIVGECVCFWRDVCYEGVFVVVAVVWADVSDEIVIEVFGVFGVNCYFFFFCVMNEYRNKILIVVVLVCYCFVEVDGDLFFARR